MSDIKVDWFGDEVFKEIIENAESGLDRMAEAIADEARDAMAEPKSGKQYPKKQTTSSAPGEAPAVQSSDLQGSVQWVNDGYLHRTIGTNLDYGRYLELGTKRIKPRPWLRPAYLKILSKWSKFFK